MIKTIVDLINSFKDDHGIAIIHNGTQITYEQLYNDIVDHSNYLKINYINYNESVIIRCKNKYKLLLGIYSTIYAGAVAVPIADTTTCDILKEIADATNANIILIDDPTFIGIADLNNLEIKKHQLITDAHVVDIKENDSALILFTSGTSGKKKGTLLSHYNLIQTSFLINEFMQLNQTIIEYVMIPLFHSFGFGRTRCVFLAKGTLILDDGIFNPLLMLKRLVKNNCNAFSGVPSVIAMLIKAGKNRFSQFGGNIRFVEIGSAPMIMEHKEFLLEHLPNANICMHYGLTEASRCCFINFRDDNGKLNSVGKPSPGVRIKIVDDNKKELHYGELGEIVVSGPNVAKGYLNGPLISNSWFYTGDIGYKDNEGYVYFNGRKDDMINVGGEKLFPLELENLINNLKLINGDFCIVGIKDNEGIYGSIPILCVTDSKYGKDDLEILNNMLWLSGVKTIFRPKTYVYLEQIPRTYNGKIIRNQIENQINGLYK
jgi:long-chain acyl-CoA synthetase